MFAFAEVNLFVFVLAEEAPEEAALLLFLGSHLIEPHLAGCIDVARIELHDLTEVLESGFGEARTFEQGATVEQGPLVFRLSFDRDLGVRPDFFVNNPSAIQVREFITPGGSSAAGFRPVPRPEPPSVLPAIMCLPLRDASSDDAWSVDGVDLTRLEDWDLRMAASDFY